MRYAVVQVGERFAVRYAGVMLRGRFHRAEQAEQWINQRLDAEIRWPVNPHRAHLRAWLLTDSNYASTNERVVHSGGT